MKKYTLFNKNTAVLDFEVESFDNIKITEVYHIDYAPLCIACAYNKKTTSLVKEFKDWLSFRKIPSYRRNYKEIMEHINVKDSRDLVFRHYGVCMSDQYWFRPFDEPDLTWFSVNFFTNPQHNAGYFIEDNFHGCYDTPDNATDGMLEKMWSNRLLYKQGYTENKQEPANEWLASEVARRLGIPYVPYHITKYKEEPASVCSVMITEDEEYIPAWQILKTKKRPNHKSEIEHYISILEQHNIPDVREQVYGMFYIDKLLMNIDRHLNNFGIIRNVNTLDWVRVCPIFDTGECMNAMVDTADMRWIDGKGKFFSNTNKKFSTYPVQYEYDLTKLQGITEDYEQLLMFYSNCSEERIKELVYGLKLRIGLLQPNDLR